MGHARVAPLVVVAAILALTGPPAVAQEFPIAVGPDSTLALSAVFDGTNFVVGVQGDTVRSTSVTVQRISPNGALVGARISLGAANPPEVAGPLAAFDGTNSLLVWTDRPVAGSGVYGRFLSPAGNLVGPAFPIAAYGDDALLGAVAFGHTNYLTLWTRSRSLYGQLVGRSGSLVGGPLPLTSNFVFDQWPLTETAAAFDGTNFLVVWQSDRGGPQTGEFDLYGCFVGETGAVGAPFMISELPSPRFNPMSVAFNGTEYLVVWERDAGLGLPYASQWNLFGRIVSPGSGMGAEFPVTAAPGDQDFPSVASSGSDFLVSWTDSPTASVVGRVYDSAGAAVDSAFTIFAASTDRFPIGGLAPGGHEFLATATRLPVSYTDGDVYGTLLHPPTAGVGDGAGWPAQVALSAPRPNPSARGTSVRLALPAPAVVSLGIYDLMGREVARLVDRTTLGAGEHVVEWNAGTEPGGVYFARVQVGSVVRSERLVLLR